MRNIPVNEPFMGNEELENVKEAITSGWVSSEGRFIGEFEKKFSGYVDRKHGVAVNNGTNALILALRALDLPKGSEVIIPTFTIISCALACIYNDLIPVFVDADEGTWNIDVAKVESKISGATKAIMPVHIYGNPVDMDGIFRIAKKYDLYIVEDFAEAIGSEYKGAKCGSFGHVSCASFYANKLVTTGEGGMCLTDDAILAEKLRTLKNLAFIPGKRFVHEELGFNFRMTNIQAAIGLAQVDRLGRQVAKKLWMGEKYSKLLSDLEGKGYLRLPSKASGGVNTFWMYGVVLNEGLGRTAADVMDSLSAKGVQTRPFFCPMHRQPAFKRFPWYQEEDLPISERLYKYGLYLPSGLTLSEEDAKYTAEQLRKVLL